MKNLFASIALTLVVASSAFATGEVIVRQDQGRNAYVDRVFKLNPNQAIGAGEGLQNAKAVNVPMTFKYTVSAEQIAALGAVTSGDIALTTLPAKSVVMNTTVKHSASVNVNVLSVGTLTSNNTNVADGATVTIGNKTYTFRTALTPTEGEVLIGADADTSLLNLIRAINHGATNGTNYKAALAHTQVTAATSVTSHAFVITAKVVGVAGQVATTETSATLSFGSGTLTAGQSLSAATARVITANNNYGTAFDVLQAASNTALDFYATPKSENFASTTVVNLHLTSTSANLSAVNAGAIDAWVTYYVRP